MKTLLLFLFSTIFFTDATAENHQSKTWEVFEIILTAQEEMVNPYINGMQEGKKPYLTATFTGTSGNAEGVEMIIPGFWDGQDKWVIRFAPPYSGKWQYITESTDEGLNEQEGILTVSEWNAEEKTVIPTRRGFIQVVSEGNRKGRYFTYHDGTPFLWIGDTWWNWTKKDIRFESFKRVADTRADQNFTVGQLFFAGNGWSESSSLLDPSCQHPKIDQIRQLERMIRYANTKGITVWVHPWWSREDLDSRIGSENIRRWWRYVIHRLHAYNVIWVLAGEYNMHNYGGVTLGLGELIKHEDPYDRITGTHPTPPAWGGGADAPQWSTAEVIHHQNWLDYNQSQPGHGRWRNEMIPEIVAKAYQKEPPKPIVVTEPWYEFIEGNPKATDIRFGAWTAILNGAAGHSYAGGHIWKAHLPESPMGADTWPMDLSFKTNTLFYEGARSISYLSSYLHQIEWWNLEPHPEYVIDNPSPYCSAHPGNEYLMYLRYGGTVKVDLSESRGKLMHYRWIDLVNHLIIEEGAVNGGSISAFSPPEDYPGVANYKDWLLHIFTK